MTTTVAQLLSQIAPMVQEDRSSYTVAGTAGTDWSSGLWNVQELIGYINDGQKQLVLDMQLYKVLAPIASVTGQRIYGDPVPTMQIDRIAFNQKPTYRTKRILLDRENPKWRTLPGVPKQYHQDQLTTKNFEVDRAPTSGMTGTGWSASGTVGFVRQITGSLTYTATPAAGPGLMRYVSTGTRSYNGGLARPPLGPVRQILSGVTNFEVLATRLPNDVTYTSDNLDIPDFTVLYLKFWVLEQMLEKEGEGQDLPRAKYCGARYATGVKLFRRLVSAMHDDVVPPQGAAK